MVAYFSPKQFTVGVLNATLDLATLVLVGVVGLLGSEVVLSPVVSGCLPSCGGWVLVGVAASRTKTFRNQNHRFQSKFAYCKLFGVYGGVIWDIMACYRKVAKVKTTCVRFRVKPANSHSHCNTAKQTWAQGTSLSHPGVDGKRIAVVMLICTCIT